ncbi:MAG: ATP-dependent sacrificial sulfur transferase LarE [Methanomicrobiales archaeon]|nr:ATP-dependent sacrificial sulfur transferase LarE [Methanomicrobiales archaeon]
MSVDRKVKDLKDLIAEKGSLLVSCSGGVDSSLLADIAREVLGERYVCVLLDSPLVPRRTLREARRTARELGLQLEVIPLPILESEEFRRNPKNRCYICKKVSARLLKERARERGLSAVADGVNVADLGKHRPGIAACDEEGICHPFVEAGISKEDIRRIARERNLPFWDMPSSACLASRIPYGEEITAEKLERIEAAEEFLRDHGFGQVRVRVHGPLARIEVEPAAMERLFAMRAEVVRAFEDLGFVYVTLDLRGFRSGSMDAVHSPRASAETGDRQNAA